MRSWPANWTVSLDLTVSSRRYDSCFSQPLWTPIFAYGFTPSISSFWCQRSYFTVIIVSEMHFNAVHCIAQPNTALHDCILYPSQYLRSRHFTGRCKSVHPWGRVSEILSIKEAKCIWAHWSTSIRNLNMCIWGSVMTTHTVWFSKHILGTPAAPDSHTSVHMDVCQRYKNDTSGWCCKSYEI